MCVEGEGRLEGSIDVIGPLPKDFLVASFGLFIISEFSVGIHDVYKIKNKIETKQTTLPPPKQHNKTGDYRKPPQAARLLRTWVYS